MARALDPDDQIAEDYTDLLEAVKNVLDREPGALDALRFVVGRLEPDYREPIARTAGAPRPVPDPLASGMGPWRSPAVLGALQHVVVAYVPRPSTAVERAARLAEEFDR